MMEFGADGIGIILSPNLEQQKRPSIRLSSWSRPEHYIYPEHRHPGKWELVYVRRGTLIHTINEIRLTQHRGDFTLLRECDSHNTENIDGEAINISISSQYFDYLQGPTEQPGEWLPRLLRDSRIIIGHVSETETDSVERQLDNLLFQQGTELEGIIFCSFFFRLLQYVMPPDHGENTERIPKWLSDCLTYFERNSNLPISIEAIQTRCGRTQEYITRCFRKYLSTTPSAYINTKRMMMAEKLLQRSDKTAKEIGWTVGYSSNSYFFRIFKQTYGTSPDAYRRRQSSDIF